MCPACGSGETQQGCCGDFMATCLKCGYRWEGETCSCMSPPPATWNVIVSDGHSPEVILDEYKPLTDEQLWGE